MSTACRRFIDQKRLGYTPSYSCFYNTFFRQLSTISEYCGDLSINNVSSLFLFTLTVRCDIFFSFFLFLNFLSSIYCFQIVGPFSFFRFIFTSISLHCVYKIPFLHSLIFLLFRKCLSSFIFSFFLSFFLSNRFLPLLQVYFAFLSKKNIYLYIYSFLFYFCI